jgi:hypothetical protein
MIKNILIILLLILFFYFISFFNSESFISDQSVDKFEYSAIIIEPRQHRALEFVLQNFTKHLDNRWQIIIFHGTENEDFVKEIVKNKLSHELYRIKLVNLNVSNLTIHDYNSLLYDKSFYDNIPTEVFLLFQTDTIICDKYKDKIYDFIKYDYVGAPWTNKEVGNGGLSLRRKSKMLEIISQCIDRKQYTPTQLHNEDAFFANVCQDRVNINKPSYEEAKEFSIETVYSDKSFGVHKPWHYQSPQQLQKINEYCPDLNQLISYNA